MPRMILLVALLHTALAAGHAKNVTSVDPVQKVLRTVNIRMQKQNTVSYTQHRHTHDDANHYDHAETLRMTLEYGRDKAAALPRFRVIQAGTTYLYNGSENFVLDSATRSITVNHEPDFEIGDSFFFHQSWANIRNILPAVIGNNTIQKSLRDTVILGKPCYNIAIHYPGQHFAALRGATPVGDSVQWHYTLTVDRATMLPMAFCARIKKQTQGDRYITVAFTDINTTKAVPAKTWHIAAYRKAYPQTSIPQHALVRAGSKNMILKNSGSLPLTR